MSDLDSVVDILRFVDIVGCTITDNVSVTGSQTGGVSAGIDCTISNSILRNNSAAIPDRPQFVGMPASSVSYSNIDGLSLVDPLAVSDGCIDADVSYDVPPRMFDLVSDIGNGSVAVDNYSSVDIHGTERKIEPSIGADEYIPQPLDTPNQVSVDSIIDGLYESEERAYWTQDRLDSIEIITTYAEMSQSLSTTLDDIPVVIRIQWNEEALMHYMNIVSLDNTITIRGIGLVPGTDLLDGLAYPEIGRLYVTDMYLANTDPTYEGLGTQYILWYLPVGVDE